MCPTFVKNRRKDSSCRGVRSPISNKTVLCSLDTSGSAKQNEEFIHRGLVMKITH